MGRKPKALVMPIPKVEKEFMKEITWTCPNRGKVTKKVKVTRYMSRWTQAKVVIGNNMLDILDSETLDVEVKEKEE